MVNFTFMCFFLPVTKVREPTVLRGALIRQKGLQMHHHAHQSKNISGNPNRYSRSRVLWGTFFNQTNFHNFTELNPQGSNVFKKLV